MFRYGADYYPEHWPEERWAVDARLMQEAGFNVVRLAEFAWSRMEPAEGQYDFAWLDRAIDLLGAHGIDIVLGTPSASPPPWLMAQHPDVFNVWPDGVRATYGSRRTTCPTSPIFRSYAERITRAMAEHYHDHPRVIGWQIDNEFGDPCYCELCQAAFQSWLHNHYDSLAALNAAWGTVFWSHEYTDWAHIPLPVLTTRNAAWDRHHHRRQSGAGAGLRAVRFRYLCGFPERPAGRFARGVSRPFCDPQFYGLQL